MEDIRNQNPIDRKENLIVLLGFPPGSGLVGSIALAHMIDELEFEHIGNITSKYFPPLAMMVDGIVNAPDADISERPVCSRHI
ncbi:PAC2 family protein [Methanogenium cariaci]|uniref:PAC2 family protein n=1 Tax=Methanogenium cariaci TaxID=2197 RepID=UPI001FE09118|nr:PAC2 family protein [Methanogenium cariaci]